jgi:serine O-acetyltransferase
MTQPRLEVITETNPVSSIWSQLRASAEEAARSEPHLGSLMNATILSHLDLANALSFQIARKIGDAELAQMSVREVCAFAFWSDPSIVAAAEADLQAVAERDPAIRSLLQPFLYFKGFQALQASRVAHWLWTQGRETLAFHLQSRISELFQIDIHPGGQDGQGPVPRPRHRHRHRRDGGGRRRCVDAARGDPGRHRRRARRPPPQDRQGRPVGRRGQGAGQHQIGDYAKVASGSVVLKPVPSGCTVAGVPARLVNCPTGRRAGPDDGPYPGRRGL